MKVHVIITIESKWSGEEIRAQVRDAVASGAVTVLIAFPYHDDPPGDWYQYYYLVCRDDDVAEQAASLGWEPQAYNPHTHTYIDLPCLHKMQSGGPGNREVVQRPEEQTDDFASGLAQMQNDPAHAFAMELEGVL